ncbi:MAG: polymerase sigma factor, sigma-70 family [Candidatus Eremiobacteraeota bacterium]|nr:polymerase sigma factor, sigma-70 family [Candidatus Eremiobacteraeota bacterium]
MTNIAGAASLDRDAFERLLVELRPKLHRYCARMTGSVIDGEDVLQDALMKAVHAFADTPSIAQPERWLFRIAHNAALDFLRRRARAEAARSNEDPDMLVDHSGTFDDREIVSTSLRTFMRLPTVQRSSVILMDVLGYSLAEIGGIMDESVPAVKSALHRGRTRLRELAREPDDGPQLILSDPERSLLAAYVDRFNARDFDAVRDMLADEVRLELVARTRLNGRREVGRYFHNYSGENDWHVRAGFVDDSPALLVDDPNRPTEAPAYFIVLGWAGGKVVTIRDFRHAPYAIEGARLIN